MGFQISPSTQHTFDQVSVLLLHFSILVWLKIHITESGSETESDILEWRLQELLVGKTDQG